MPTKDYQAVVDDIILIDPDDDWEIKLPVNEFDGASVTIKAKASKVTNATVQVSTAQTSTKIQHPDDLDVYASPIDIPLAGGTIRYVYNEALNEWGIFSIGGHIGTPIINIDDTDSPYDAPNYDCTIIADSTSGNITINLPAVAVAKRRYYSIKNVGTGTVTADPNSTEQIENTTTKALSSQYDAIRVQCDGVEWWLL